MLTDNSKTSKVMLIVAMSLILGFIFTSCNGNSDGDNSSGNTNDNSTTNSSLSSCEKAMKAAAEVSDMQDTVEDIDPEIQACGSMEEFTAASSKFPEALDGADEEIFVTNRCTYNPSLRDTAICKSIVE